MKIFGLAGWSGSGKTTLMVRLLPVLTGRGLKVSSVKHAHHSFDVDRPGKDSYEHRNAGATEVMVSSANRWALMHEHRGAPEPDLPSLIARMTPVDLLIVEGFKHDAHPKLEVHRPSLGKPLICSGDRHVVVVASDEPLTGIDLPVLDIDDVSAIADFVLRYCGLDAAAARGEA